MGHATATSEQVRNPGPFATPSGVKTTLMVLTVIGAAAFIGGLITAPERAWYSFVQNHFYFLSLALGGMFFASIQWLTGAMWSAPIRRVSESFSAYLPIALVAFVILYFGMHDVYIWTHPDHVRGDLVLEHKAGYLNVGFFMVRNLIAFGLWIFFARKMIGHSVAQDGDHLVMHTERNRGIAPIFLLIFAVTFTMASFDLLMSLDPHWFSTMFGVYCFSGLFYSTLALTCLMSIYLRRQGSLAGIVNDNHLHDLGKFMLAFTIFWAYIGFSQFMLIWYANMPEETFYFTHRFNGGWFYVSLFLLIGKFLVPFFVLLPRDSKRKEKVLVPVAIFMLIAQWIDMLWITQPQLFKEGPHLGWIELLTPLAFLGLFGLAMFRFLARNNTVAIGDPRLAEAVFHHHQ